MRIWIALLVCISLPAMASGDEHLEEAEDASASITESARTYVPAKAIEKKAPRYPGSELRRYREAWVQLSYCIDESGVPQNVSVVDSVGDRNFERQAMSTIEDWRFEPAVVDGQPSWQSNNNQLVYFALEGQDLGADRDFIRSYKKIGKLLTANELDEADILFERLFSSDDLSLYESSKLWVQRAKYELNRGDLYMADLALRRASASKGKWIEAASYQQLLSLRVRVEAKLGQYADAISAYGRLKKTAGEDDPAVLELQPLMDKVQAMVDGDAVLKTSAEIRKKGECYGCNDSYIFKPARPQFSFSDVVGELASIKMRCKHKYYESKISDLVEWQIPETWGGCLIEIYGVPGTTFNILMYPNE